CRIRVDRRYGSILGSTFGAEEGTTMAEDTTLTSQTWLVAIDIGKAFHAVLVEGGDGKRQQFRMANHVEDYDRLVVFLRGLPGPARIALEPTGDFHRTLPTDCSERGSPWSPSRRWR